MQESVSFWAMHGWSDARVTLIKGGDAEVFRDEGPVSGGSHLEVSTYRLDGATIFWAVDTETRQDGGITRSHSEYTCALAAIEAGGRDHETGRSFPEWHPVPGASYWRADPPKAAAR